MEIINFLDRLRPIIRISFSMIFHSDEFSLIYVAWLFICWIIVALSGNRKKEKKTTLADLSKVFIRINKIK